MVMDAQKVEALNSDINKILVIQTAFPGDAILTLPMIQQLKIKHSNSAIDVLCIPSTKIIFEASPYVESAIEFDKKGKHKSVFAFLKFAQELKKGNYDAVYSPHRSLRSALLTLQLNVKQTYGFDNSALKFAYSNVVKYNLSDHEVKRNLSLLDETFEDEKWKILPELVSSESIKIKIDEFIKSSIKTEKIIAVAPSSVWKTKMYPLEYYNKIIKHLINSGYVVLLIGGKDDYQVCEELKSKFSESVFNLTGIFLLTETVELLKHVRLLISNDSAPTHLAMCADIPVLTIYCSTVPGFGFYPYNKKSEIISFEELNCKPCGIHGYNKCPISSFDCGYNLKPDIVIEKINKMISDETKS